MQWTKVSPSSEGYYWVRYTPQTVGMIVYVSRQTDGAWLVHTMRKYGWLMGVLMREYPEAHWGDRSIDAPLEPTQTTPIDWE